MPNSGWFIPAGFFEDKEDYEERRKGILEITKDWTFNDAKLVIERFWLPHSTYHSFDKWAAEHIYPRMQFLNRGKRFTEDDVKKMIISYLINIGWDPENRWYCIPPEEPYEDIHFVINRMWDMLNHRTYPRIKNEYLKLFNNNVHRWMQWVDHVDRSIPMNNDRFGEFLVTREKVLISHLVWLAKTDMRVYDKFYKRIMKEVNHKISLGMAINDPLMTSEERFRRDIMLMTQPIRNEYLDRMEGHNQIRDNIIGEHVPSQDHEEVKYGLEHHYFRGRNIWMEDRIAVRYMYYLEHRQERNDIIDQLEELPTRLKTLFNEQYGNYTNEMIATIGEMLLTCYRKDIKRARWTSKDTIKHCSELLRDLYPFAIRVQCRLDSNSFEKVVNNHNMNLIGAIRVIFSNDDAKEEFYRMARRFGDQDPRHNDQIVEMMTDIAVETINQHQVQKRFGVKNPQHILLRKEQPRNPKNLVENYFGYYADSDEFGNDQFDLLSNRNDVEGRRNRRFLTPESEEESRINEDHHHIDVIKDAMEAYHVDRINDACERYLPSMEAHKMNYVSYRHRDQFKSKLDDPRLRKDREALEHTLKKYDLDDVEMEEDDTNLDEIDESDLVSLVKNCFTIKGQRYIINVLRKFDLEALAEYDEVQDRQRILDRRETLRHQIEDIITSGDPLYILGGKGKKGSFDADDVEMNEEMMYDKIDWMLMDEMNEFVQKYLTKEEISAIRKEIGNDGNIEDLRHILMANARILADRFNAMDTELDYTVFDGMDIDEEDEDDSDMVEPTIDDIRDLIRESDIGVVLDIVDELIDEKEARPIHRMVEKKFKPSIIRARIMKLLIDTYGEEELINIFFGLFDNLDDESIDDSDRYNHGKSKKHHQFESLKIKDDEDDIRVDERAFDIKSPRDEYIEHADCKDEELEQKHNQYARYIRDEEKKSGKTEVEREKHLITDNYTIEHPRLEYSPRFRFIHREKPRTDKLTPKESLFIDRMYKTLLHSKSKDVIKFMSHMYAADYDELVSIFRNRDDATPEEIVDIVLGYAIRWYDLDRFEKRVCEWMNVEEMYEEDYDIIRKLSDDDDDDEDEDYIVENSEIDDGIDLFGYARKLTRTKNADNNLEHYKPSYICMFGNIFQAISNLSKKEFIAFARTLVHQEFYDVLKDAAECLEGEELANVLMEIIIRFYSVKEFLDLYLDVFKGRKFYTDDTHEEITDDKPSSYYINREYLKDHSDEDDDDDDDDMSNFRSFADIDEDDEEEDDEDEDDEEDDGLFHFTFGSHSDEDDDLKTLVTTHSGKKDLDLREAKREFIMWLYENVDLRSSNLDISRIRDEIMNMTDLEFMNLKTHMIQKFKSGKIKAKSSDALEKDEIIDEDDGIEIDDSDYGSLDGMIGVMSQMNISSDDEDDDEEEEDEEDDEPYEDVDTILRRGIRKLQDQQKGR